MQISLLALCTGGRSRGRKKRQREGSHGERRTDWSGSRNGMGRISKRRETGKVGREDEREGRRNKERRKKRTGEG